MERSSMKQIFSLIFLFIATALSTFAQTGTTSLRGTVTDKSGATISAAKVTLSNTSQGFHREAQTVAGGEYEFLALQPGIFALTVEMSGFRKYETKNLQLLVNVPSTLNVVLEIGTATETIEVSSQT